MIDTKLDVMYKEVGDMKNSLSDMIRYIEYLNMRVNDLNTRVNDLNNYIKFMNIDESISYDEWFKIRNDAEELIKFKRNITINEIIK